MKNLSSIWFFIIIVILGILIGNVISELMLLIPLNILTKIFSTGFPISLHTATFDMNVFQFDFGFTLNANLGTVFGIFLGIYLYRWMSR